MCGFIGTVIVLKIEVQNWFGKRAVATASYELGDTIESYKDGKVCQSILGAGSSHAEIILCDFRLWLQKGSHSE